MRRIWTPRRRAAGLAFLIIAGGGAAIDAALAEDSQTGAVHYKAPPHEKTTVPARTFDTVVIQHGRRFVKQVIPYDPGNPKSRATTIEAAKIDRPGT
jgi:hypothetical protein